MSTIVGVECDGGAVIAADTALVRDGRVESTSKRRLFDFADAAAAAVGDDVDEFGRRLDAEVRGHRTEHGEAISIDRLARIAADIAAETGVEAVVTARDDDGAARIRAIDRAGGVIEDAYAARGSGAAAALGQLEAVDLDVGLDDAEATLREVLSAVAERDAGTGENVDTWRLADAGD